MKEGMTREQSAILRGIAILMMIYHHVFATPEIYELEYFSVLQFGGVNVELWGSISLSAATACIMS